MTGDCVRVGDRVALVGGGEYGLSDPLDSHTYLLRTATGGVLVDAGATADHARLAANLAAAGVGLGDVAGVLLTHAHADHAGGVSALATRIAGRVYAADDEAHRLSSGDEVELGLEAAKLTGTYPQDYVFSPYDGAQPVEDKQVLAFDDLRVQALVTPGHSPGSTVWLARWHDYAAMFTGDSVFRGGWTSVLNAPGSSAAELRTSLPRLTEYDFDGLFPGHGPFRVRGGRQDVAMAAARSQASVIPNRATPAYRPSAQLTDLAEGWAGDRHG